MRFCASVTAALFGLSLAGPLRATTERVVLLRPEAEDPVLLDAWNRLAAELKIHHFDVEVVDSGAAPGERPSVEVELSNVARSESALAALALVQETGTTSVDVWLVDRVSGKTTMRRIAVRPGKDASSVLAIRAVDLLRGSLREYDAGERPPPDVVGVVPGPVPEAAAALSARRAPRTHLFAEALALEEGRDFGFAAGPALGLSYDVADRVGLGVLVAGPILGASIGTPEGRATLQEELAWFEARWSFLRVHRFSAGADVAFGGLLLGATGQPLPPLVGKSDHVAAFLGAAGLYADFGLTPRIAVDVSIRALSTVPRLGVAVDQASHAIGFPFGAASAGMVVGL